MPSTTRDDPTEAPTRGVDARGDRPEAASAASSWSGRASRIVVDLDAIAGNVRYFRGLVSAGSAVMAVVKADGYGHGAVEVATEVIRAGAAQLGVATVDEGVQLRAAGMSAQILVLGPIEPGEAQTAVEHRLSLAVADRRFAELLDRVAAGSGIRNVPVHLKIDTGMHRFGSTPADALGVARAIAAAASLAFEGVYTHFADADADDEAATAAQAAVFESILRTIADDGIRPRYRHAANSAATLRGRTYDYDLVRIGIALYGLPPAPGYPMPTALRPALGVVSKVARLIDLREGDGVSYGFTYRAARDERAALVPLGYADGYRRALSNRGWMLVGGQRAPVLGRVCMDQTVVGLGSDRGVKVGDPVAVMGGAGPSLDEVAATAGTISYEIATGLTRRLPRTYVRGSRPVTP